jgi:arsenite-transporting ATPase
VSSALATSLASTSDLKVLIVSTDPAHSLGDALDEDLRSSHGQPRALTDPLTAGRLFACEVDAGAALESFRESLAAFDVDRLATTLGVPLEILESLGLGELSGLLNNPPPGLDEIVALGNVLDMNDKQYDVVVVDTAPTGHTLRLLALPQFLDGLLGKLIQLRLKLSGLANTLQAFLGNAEANERAKAMDDAANRLDEFRTKMANLKRQLEDSIRTNFVVVTVPTKLGVAESKRLIAELSTQGVKVTDIVVNQFIGDLSMQDSTALQAYYDRRQSGQNRWIQNLKDTLGEVSSSEAFNRHDKGTILRCRTSWSTGSRLRWFANICREPFVLAFDGSKWIRRRTTGGNFRRERWCWEDDNFGFACRINGSERAQRCNHQHGSGALTR